MPKTIAAAALLALAATPALAQSFKLDKIEIIGVTSVPVQPLKDALKDKPGDTITTNDVLADQDTLTKELETAHVTGGVKTSLRNKPNGHKDIIFNVEDKGVQAPVVTTTALHIAHVTFAGNKNASTDVLEAAAQMKPGDVITDQSLADAQTRIGAAYKKASANVHDDLTTTIDHQITYPSPGQVDVTWRFTETTKKAKKKRNTEDEGGFKTESN